MKILRYLVIASAVFAALPAQASITAFTHIVIIVQENRTPDNLFAAMCQQLGGTATCTPGDLSTYDILTSNWNNKGNLIAPVAVDLGTNWEIRHLHNQDWIPMCDLHTGGITCPMDGAINETCVEPVGTSGCTTNNSQPEFTYVQRKTGGVDVLGPYFTLAQP